MQIINRMNQILKIAVLLSLIFNFNCWANDNSERAAGAEVESVDMISSYEQDENDIDIDWTDLPKNIQAQWMLDFGSSLDEAPKQIKFKQLTIIIQAKLKTNFNKINLEKVRDHFSTTKEGRKLSRTLDKHIKAKAAAERKAKLNKQQEEINRRQAELNKRIDDLEIKAKKITKEAQNTIEQSRVQKTVPQEKNSKGEVGLSNPKEQTREERVERANKEFSAKPEESRTYNPYTQAEMDAGEAVRNAAAAEVKFKGDAEFKGYLKEKKRQEKIEAEKKSAAESHTRVQKEYASKPEEPKTYNPYIKNEVTAAESKTQAKKEFASKSDEINTHNPSNKEMAAAEEGVRSKRKAEKQKSKAKQDTSSEEQRASANQTEKLTNSVSVAIGEAKVIKQPKSDISGANSSSSYVRHKSDIKSVVDKIKITNFDLVNDALSE